MSSSCNIILENYNNAFYAGQTVSGRVECHFHSEKKVKNIHVRLTGKASVRWTESESYYDHSTKKHKSRQVTYWAEEEYFSIQINLISTPADHMMIPPGNYTYPFQYILPQNLPASMEGTHYRVRYKIKATVNRPWKFDYEAQAIYTIFAPLDLNFFPNLQNSVKTSDDKTICCWCCASGPIELDVSVSKTGFAIGEKFIVSCYISNMSNVTVDEVKIKIKQVIEYTAHSPRTKTRYEHNEITRAHEAGVGAHGENTMNVELQIPPSTTIPNLTGCTIIRSKFYIEVEAVLPMPHANLDVSIPIQLGHVALNQIGAPEVVARAPTFVESTLPFSTPSFDTEDFVMIDHVEPAPPGMPMPSGPSFGYPGPPPVGGMSMPMPQMPMPSYPPSEKHPGYPGGEPSAPGPDLTQNPSAPQNSSAPQNPSAPPMGAGFVNPNGAPYPAAPPSYDQAISTPEKKPL